MPASGSAIRAGRAFVEIFADDSPLVRGLRVAQSRIRTFGQDVSRIGQGMIAISAPAIGGIALASRIFAGFQEQMSAVQAVTGATADDMGALTAKARELGASTSFSAAEAAEGMKFLGMAGFSTEQILAGIPAVLNLAKAGAVELGVAADIASDVSSAFGLAADEITRVADVMALAASSANVSIEGLGESFKFAAPAGAAAGQEIEEVTAALATLGNSGLKGSIAGRNLAIVLKQLANTGVQEKLAALGVQVQDAQGNFLDLHQIIAKLRGPLSRMSETARVRFLTEAFGEASKAAQILVASSSGFVDLRSRLDDAAGSADRMSRVMGDNLAGDAKTLMSAVEELAISVIDALEPSFRKLLGTLTTAARNVAEWAKENRSMIVLVAKAAAVMGVAGGTLVGLGATIGLVAAALGGFTTAATAAATGIKLLGTASVTSRAALTAMGGAAGAARLAMTALSGALTILIGVQIGAWAIGATQAMADLNRELQKSIRLTGQMNQLGDKRVNRLIDDATESGDTSSLREALEQEKKNILGLQASLNGQRKLVSRLESERGLLDYYGRYVRGLKDAGDEERQNLENLERSLDAAKARADRLEEAMQRVAEARERVDQPASAAPAAEAADDAEDSQDDLLGKLRQGGRELADDMAREIERELDPMRAQARDIIEQTEARRADIRRLQAVGAIDPRRAIDLDQAARRSAVKRIQELQEAFAGSPLDGISDALSGVGSQVQLPRLDIGLDQRQEQFLAMQAVGAGGGKTPDEEAADHLEHMRRTQEWIAELLEDGNRLARDNMPADPADFDA